jgi:hypothetical protein
MHLQIKNKNINQKVLLFMGECRGGDSDPLKFLPGYVPDYRINCSIRYVLRYIFITNGIYGQVPPLPHPRYTHVYIDNVFFFIDNGDIEIRAGNRLE